MSKVISRRHSSQVVLAALSGVLLLATTARAEPKTWNLANDFPLTKLNPAPDKYGHKSVWTYMYSNLKKPGYYLKLSQFYDAATEESTCGVKEFYDWNKTKSNLFGTPAIFFNAGETVEPNTATANRCNPDTTFPAKTVFMHPQFSIGADAVVRWKSTVTGMVAVSGSVQCTDPHITGISWELDKGATVVIGPTETYEDNLMPFGPTAVSVVKGEFLYLKVGLAEGANGASDTTAVNWTITSS
jgi:hypothetical protein